MSLEILRLVIVPAESVGVAVNDNAWSIFFPLESFIYNEQVTVGGIVVAKLRMFMILKSIFS